MGVWGDGGMVCWEYAVMGVWVTLELQRGVRGGGEYVAKPRKPFIMNPAMMHFISLIPLPAAYGAIPLTKNAETKANTTYRKLTPFKKYPQTNARRQHWGSEKQLRTERESSLGEGGIPRRGCRRYN
jgi:hypothetical protein